MNITKIRMSMQHSVLLKNSVPYFRKSLVVRLIHYMQGYYSVKKNKNAIENFLKCYKMNKEKYEEVYNILEDEKSKKVYRAVLKFREHYKYSDIKNVISYPQYFVEDIFDKYEDEVFVDGGAYTGDTICSMLKVIPSSCIKKIYAWEPDAGNSKILQYEVKKMLSRTRGKVEVELCPYVLYKEVTNISFQNTANGASKIDEEGSVSVLTNTIDNCCVDATFIKMDIEGGEIEALYGAKNTIINNRPKLAICIYHTDNHLYEIPLLIHKWVPEYKIYIRHHGQMEAETVMYALI